MPQVGIYSAYQLGLHNHLDDNNGGILNDYSRYGAYRRPYRTGALALNFPNDAVRSTVEAAFVLVKETRVNVAQLGQVQIGFEMKGTDGITNAHGRLYVNGVAVGADHGSNSAVYVAYTDNYDVGFTAGDLIQIYAYSEGGADTTSIRNFRIRYDWHLPGFGDGTVNNLAAALALTDVDILDCTIII